MGRPVSRFRLEGRTATPRQSVSSHYVAFETFEPMFRAELEEWFPDVEVSIEHGVGARVEYCGIESNDELVHECSESAFKKAINQLNG